MSLPDYVVTVGNRNIRKIDSNGNYIWTVGYSPIDVVPQIAMHGDGSIYIVRQAGNFGARNTFIDKLDPDGNLIWTFNVNTIKTNNRINSLATSRFGSIYFSVSDNSSVEFGAGLNRFVKLNKNGDVIWNNSFSNDTFFHITADNNDDVIFSTQGTTRKVSSNGTPLWTLNYQMQNQIAVDENNIIYGYRTQPNRAFIKLDPDGNELFNQSIGTFNSYQGLDLDSNGNIYVLWGNRSIRKYNSSLQQQWSVTHPTVSHVPRFISISQADGLFVGFSAAALNSPVRKYDINNGNLLWSTTGAIWSTFTGGVAIATEPLPLLGPPYRINFNNKQITNIIKDGKEVKQIYKGNILLS